jgi:hypothetical protein
MKTVKKLVSRFNYVISVLILIAVIASCEKHDGDALDPVPPTGTTLKTTVAGKIVDNDGLILSGVTVKLGALTTVTDSRGYFLFQDTDVSEERILLTASLQGYFDCIAGKKTQGDGANYFHLTMQQYPTPATINTATGGVVNVPGGGTITFPSNAFVDQNGNTYSGSVKVYSRHISPGSDDFEKLVPGGDLLGVDVLGDSKSLYSFGMTEALLKNSSGSPLELAPGITAEIKFPIATSQNAAALTTIPLWYLDEETGIWQEEGQATRVGTNYIGNVSHFSIWNCDYQGERTSISGLVLDCQNIPLANITVTINGFMNVVTNNAGEYSTWVPAGYTIQSQVLQLYNPFIISNSPIVSITAASSVVNYMPDLIVPCATRIKGSITDCSGNTLNKAFIYFSWNGYNTFYYSPGGKYNIMVPPNTSIKITGANTASYGEGSVVSGAIATSITVPDILLCNNFSSSSNDFIFTVNQNGVSQTYALINPLQSNLFTDANSDGVFESAQITLSGLIYPGQWTCNVQIGLFGETNGYYSLLMNSVNNIYIDIDSLGVVANGNFTNYTSNRLTVSDYGAPGSQFKANFEFDFSNGTVTNGELSVTR